MTAPQDDILDLLAAYALDALEPEDITRLHTLLAERPDLRATLAELRASSISSPMRCRRPHRRPTCASASSTMRLGGRSESQPRPL